MAYKELQRNIDNGMLRPVYLFTGEEEHLMDIYINRIKESIIDEGLEALNYTEIEGKENNFEDILNACETLPFMSDKKMVYVKNLMELIDNNKDLSDKLNNYLPSIDDHVVLILKDKSNSLRRNTKLYKTVNKLNGVIDFKRLDARELSSWIKSILKKNGKDISNTDLNYFIQKSSYMEYRSEKSLQELNNELIKIVNHSKQDIITREDIDSNFVEILDTNIFNLLDNITRKNTEAALRIFNEMYRANEPLPRILFMIIRQLRLILKYKVFKARGYNDVETRNKLDVRAYEYGKISGSSRSYSVEELEGHLEYILELDKKQKTSTQDEKLALEMLIVRLTM